MSIIAMRIFFRCSDKELQKSRVKVMKLGKKHLITTFWENDNEALYSYSEKYNKE